jgi:hypothetical protein
MIVKFRILEDLGFVLGCLTSKVCGNISKSKKLPKSETLLVAEGYSTYNILVISGEQGFTDQGVRRVRNTYRCSTLRMRAQA